MFGKIAYGSAQWLISTQPHVALRMKRVFPKIWSGQQGQLRLSDTTENARDLEWFLVRYPHEVTHPELLAQRSMAHKEKETLVSQLLSGLNGHRLSYPMAVPPRPYQLQAALLARTTKGLLCADDVGLGKAQPLSSEILTPKGWTTMGRIKLGDPIVDPNGGVGHVEGIYPQGNKEIFRITTSDGIQVECCDDHLWFVQTANDRKRGNARVVPLKEIRKRLHGKTHPSKRFGNKIRYGGKSSVWFIPTIAPVEWADPPKLLIPPYSFGVLLGDGSFRSRLKLTAEELEIVHRVKSQLPEELELRRDNSSPIEWHFCYSTLLHERFASWNGKATSARCKGSVLKRPDDCEDSWTLAIKILGLKGRYSHDKFIPEDYLRATVADRIELLKGLMDTDGECGSDYGALFSSSSHQLAYDVLQLVRSLGGLAKISGPREGKYKKKDGTIKRCKDNWNVSVQLPYAPFYLQRKADLWHRPNLSRAIKNVVSIGSRPAQCIKVSTPNNLYITDGYLPTHNTVVALAMFVDPALRPALVVTLTHLPGQWKSFIERFTPHLTTHIVKRGTPYDFRLKDGQLPDVILMNYHKLRGWAGTLSGVIRSITFDETQELRHSNTDKYAAASSLAQNTPVRLGLSATPIYNYGAEMFNVMECISPGALGSRSEFITEWCSGDIITKPKAFGTWLRSEGLMLRRTRAEVGRELPACSKVPHTIEADGSYIDKATADCEELAKIILASTQDYQGQKMHASAQFDMRMRQATGIAKAPFCADFARILLEEGEQIVLVGWHRAVYEIWLKRLHDFVPVLYTGTESPGAKEFSKTRFLRGESRVMLLSLRAGQGLDGLQDVCSTVVFGELDWSPGVMEQVIGRVFRDGQKKPVFAYYLLSNEGSDPIVADTLGLKTQQIEGIRNPDAELITELQVDPDHIKKLATQYLKHRMKRKASHA